MLLWAFFIAVIFGGVGKVYGIHYLFLDPEYLGKVSFLSFLWVGLALGNFIVAYQITSYILDGHRFPFLGILEWPFGKYSLNNSLIPVIVVLVYIAAILGFQIRSEQTLIFDVLIYVLGLVLGIIVMLVIMYYYFRFTNKDIFRYLAGSVDKRLRKSRISRERMMDKYQESRKKEYNVDYYFDLKLRFRSCRSIQDFYDRKTILKVFDQNHFNSVLFELVIILIIFLLGVFIENPVIQIPAAASALLLFSILVMLVGAISYWFRGWGVAFILALFLLANFVSRTGIIQNINPAKGLDYKKEKAQYSLENLRIMSSVENFEEDKLQMVHALTHWREKNGSEVSKPKIVFLCVSGGGQRAALWSLNVLQKSDSILSGDLFRNVFMISGASGGMIGAAYYRELYLRKKMGEEIDMGNPQWMMNIAKDNLNPIIFSLVVNDSFFKIRKFEYENRTYYKDRGFVFENHLNQNLGGILDKKLSDYTIYENNADIPVLLMSPIISNDGRKLYISASPVSFMTITQPGLETSESDQKVRGVDFNRLFKDHGASSLGFLSALRMSASFPYITPTISLPSEPRIEVMDAGIADNFGIQDALRFIFVMKRWIREHTAGVVLMIVRDTRKTAPIEKRSFPSLADRFTYPISSVYNNLGNIQDVNNESQIENAKTWLEVPLETVAFEYDTYTLIRDISFSTEEQEVERKEIERASLSWHLTSKEKRNIRENIHLPHNIKALKQLKNTLEIEPN